MAGAVFCSSDLWTLLLASELPWGSCSNRTTPVLERAPHERLAPRWLYVVVALIKSPSAGRPRRVILEVIPRVESQPPELEEVLAPHLDERNGKVTVWVVGRPHSHSMMRDDPDHPSNRRDLAVELARWVDELAAFMDWSGLFLAPFAALEAWQHPQDAQLPSDIPFAVSAWTIFAVGREAAFGRAWYPYPTPHGRPAVLGMSHRLELIVAAAGLAPLLVPHGFVLGTNWVGGLTEMAAGERRGTLAMSDRAFRGKILDTMPVEHRAGVVLPGDPVESRVEAAERGWVQYMELRGLLHKGSDER